MCKCVRGLGVDEICLVYIYIVYVAWATISKHCMH